MSFELDLEPGQTISNEELRKIFKCGSQGGMRRSLETKSLVIVSDSSKAVYQDRWDEDGILHYTGMGLKGDQKLDFAQNKTLAESPKNGVDVYLFEVFEKGQYTYAGKVELVGKPYQEEQLDENSELRSVWIFPLRLAGARNRVTVPDQVIKKNEEARQKKAKVLTLEELEKRTQHSSGASSVRLVTTNYYERNPFITQLAKKRADGVCQLCELPAPFFGKTGEPYLETHHIEWLSNGGSDSIHNVVALCPNCHAKMHVLDSDQDKRKLRAKLMTAF
jgi:5-methylcytosine-specific restriction protein A